MACPKVAGSTVGRLRVRSQDPGESHPRQQRPRHRTSSRMRMRPTSAHPAKGIHSWRRRRCCRGCQRRAGATSSSSSSSARAGLRNTRRCRRRAPPAACVPRTARAKRTHGSLARGPAQIGPSARATQGRATLPTGQGPARVRPPARAPCDGQGAPDMPLIQSVGQCATPPPPTSGPFRVPILHRSTAPSATGLTLCQVRQL